MLCLGNRARREAKGDENQCRFTVLSPWDVRESFRGCSSLRLLAGEQLADPLLSLCSCFLPVPSLSALTSSRRVPGETKQLETCIGYHCTSLEPSQPSLKLSRLIPSCPTSVSNSSPSSSSLFPPNNLAKMPPAKSKAAKEPTSDPNRIYSTGEIVRPPLQALPLPPTGLPPRRLLSPRVPPLTLWDRLQILGKIKGYPAWPGQVRPRPRSTATPRLGSAGRRDRSDRAGDSTAPSDSSSRVIYTPDCTTGNGRGTAARGESDGGRLRWTGGAIGQNAP